MIKRKLFVVALLMGAAFTPAKADDVSNRVDQLQQQLQQLVGQVEELNCKRSWPLPRGNSWVMHHSRKFCR
jgi:peptidoglycan hydrolase CwlO-like protein